jgi:hypothetical protein
MKKKIDNKDFNELKNEMGELTLPVYFSHLTKVEKSKDTVFYISLMSSSKHKTKEHLSNIFYKYISLVNVK